MTLAIQTDPAPLRVDEHGVVRVGGTRVTLDTLLVCYNHGYSAEDLAEAFDTVGLANVHAVIAYYLRHKEQVDAYLAEGQRQGEELRREIEARFPTSELRKKLLARKQAMERKP